MQQLLTGLRHFVCSMGGELFLVEWERQNADIFGCQGTLPPIPADDHVVKIKSMSQMAADLSDGTRPLLGLPDLLQSLEESETPGNLLTTAFEDFPADESCLMQHSRKS